MARVPAGARPRRAPPRRGAARRARPVGRRVRRPPEHRRGARPADPDAPARRPGPPQQERRDAAHRPARRRRARRAERLPRRRPRRRGRPDRGRACAGCAPRRGPTCAASSDHFLDVVDAGRARGVERAMRPSPTGPGPGPTIPAAARPDGAEADARRRRPDRVVPGPAVRGHERVRLPGLGAALLPGRTARAADLLPHYAARLPAVELNNTLLPAAVAGQGRGLAGRDAARRSGSSVKAQRGGSFRALTDRPGRQRAVADRSVPGVRGAARGPSCSGSRTGRGATTPKLAALLAAWPRRPAADAGVPGRVVARRRDVRGAGRRRAPRCARPSSPEDETPPTSGGPGRSCTCGCAGTTTPTPSSTPGPPASSPFLEAGDDAFVFFRHDEVGRGPELALELAAALESGDGVVAAPRRPARIGTR